MQRITVINRPEYIQVSPYHQHTTGSHNSDNPDTTLLPPSSPPTVRPKDQL